MKPMETIYRLAHGQRDLRACQALARAQGLSVTFGWPTVLADRRGIVLGCLGTHPSNKAVLAGPLCISPAAPRPLIIMMRLIEAYEVLLHRAGVRFYFFAVDDANPAWRGFVEKLGHVAYHQTGTGTLYRREVA